MPRITKGSKESVKQMHGYVDTADGRLYIFREKGRLRARWVRIGQSSKEFDSIKDITRIKDNDPILKHTLIRELMEDKPKRIYRRKQDLPDPNKGHMSESNLLTKKLGPRVSADHLKLFNRCAEKSESGRAALERAIELLANELDVDS